MYKLDLEKAEEPVTKKQGSSKKICLYFTDYAKAFVCVDHNKL